MEFDFKNIKEKFKHKSVPVVERVERNFSRDWKIIFSLFIIGAITLFAYGAQSFFSVISEEAFFSGEVEQPTIQTLNVSELQETLDYYEAKGTLFERLKQEEAFIVDPSL